MPARPFGSRSGRASPLLRPEGDLFQRIDRFLVITNNGRKSVSELLSCSNKSVLRVHEGTASREGERERGRRKREGGMYFIPFLLLLSTLMAAEGGQKNHQ